jgi:hypothetical protein
MIIACNFCEIEGRPNPGRSRPHSLGLMFYMVAIYYSRLNIICYIVADCNVQVHLMRRRMHGMLLQSTLHFKEAQWIQLRL